MNYKVTKIMNNSVKYKYHIKKRVSMVSARYKTLSTRASVHLSLPIIWIFGTVTLRRFHQLSITQEIPAKKIKEMK